MPTVPGTTSTPLTPQSALETISGLITEVGEDQPETPAPDATAESPAAPAPPAETADTPQDDAADPEDAVHSVPVDGSPVEVSLRDLKKSFSFQEHLTRKAQAHAERERDFEAERTAMLDRGQKYADGLERITQALKELQGEPDWPTLRQQLPAEEFLKHKADWEASKAHTEKLRAEADRTRQQLLEDQQKEFQKHLRAEQDKLFAAIPDWNDEDKRKTEQTKLLATAKTYGFTEQDFKNVTDHRAILMLRDAMRYRELHREPSPQTKVKTAGIKTAKPGTPDRPRPNAEYTKKFERAAKSGRQRDAMDAIADLLD